MTKQLPYGSWPSALSAKSIAQKGVRLGHIQIFEGRTYWLESRPEEKGRGVIVSVRNDGSDRKDETPEGFSVRSKVHEYGGADFLVASHAIYFANETDQRVYRQQGANVVPITPALDEQRHWRYNDFSLANHGRWLYAVRERHEKNGVHNEVVAIDTADEDSIKVVHSSFDFYSYPRVSPDGSRLCFTAWNHPQMPWQGTELWLTDINTSGDASAPHYVAGGADESIYQPSWSPAGVLHFVSDRTGWWNIYSLRDGILNALTPIDWEFGIPQWIFATNTYCFFDEETLIATYIENGNHFLCEIRADSGHIEPIDIPLKSFTGYLATEGESIILGGASPVLDEGVYVYHRPSANLKCLNREYVPEENESISIGKPFTYISANGRKAFANFYPPRHNGYEGESGEKPPLIVMIHGGPTAMANTSLDLKIQFWTQRGFAVVDVNYAGSTGFGKEYRQLLDGQWGVVDVEDCVFAARHLVNEGLVDGKRLLIRGGSAGGFTTLRALLDFDDFAAGMSRYGVTDLKAISEESHKFEQHYNDSLIGPLPECLSVYQHRSPVNALQKLSCPLLVLQGSDDKVVPPSQSEKVVAALEKQKLAYAYLLFEGEGHGFRQPENVEAALNAELSFYRQILKIASDEKIPLLEIKNFS